MRGAGATVLGLVKGGSSPACLAALNARSFLTPENNPSPCLPHSSAGWAASSECRAVPRDNQGEAMRPSPIWPRHPGGRRRTELPGAGGIALCRRAWSGRGNPARLRLCSGIRAEAVTRHDARGGQPDRWNRTVPDGAAVRTDVPRHHRMAWHFPDHRRGRPGGVCAALLAAGVAALVGRTRPGARGVIGVAPNGNHQHPDRLQCGHGGTATGPLGADLHTVQPGVLSRSWSLCSALFSLSTPL